MRFIVSADADADSLQSDHFKELGRWISVSLSEDKIKVEIGIRLSQDLEKVDLSGVNGPSKLWLHFLVSKLSWVFLVHDLSVSFAQGLDKKVIPRLKSWAGLFRAQRDARKLKPEVLSPTKESVPKSLLTSTCSS